MAGLRVERLVTIAAGLVEYRHTDLLVALATGAPRRAEVSLDGVELRSVEVRPGQVHVIPAGTRLAVRLHAAAENLLVTLSERWFDGRSGRLRFVFGADDPLLAQLIRTIATAVEGEPGGEGCVRALGEALVAHLCSTYGTREGERALGRGRRPTQLLDSVARYIEANVGEELSLRRLAGVAGVSVFNFAHRFKTETGVSPHQYVLQRRVERAKELLSASHLSIADVALRCGFGDQSAFTTVFRRLTRQTPTAFRDTRRGP